MNSPSTSFDEYAATGDRHGGDPARAVAEADAVLTRVHVFFESWFPRLEELLEKCGQIAEKGAALQQQIAEFESEKADWQQQRESETEQFQDVVQQLSAAWLQLESEQRELLRSKSTVAHGADASPGEVAVPPVGPPPSLSPDSTNPPAAHPAPAGHPVAAHDGQGQAISSAW